MYGNIVCNIYIYTGYIPIMDLYIIEPLSTPTGCIIGTDTPGTETMDNICFKKPREAPELPNLLKSLQLSIY